MIGLGHPLVTRVVRVAKTQNISSIADFVAARYGKSERVAALVSLIALVGSIPYIALQLKAVSSSLDVFLDAASGIAAAQLPARRRSRASSSRSCSRASPSPSARATRMRPSTRTA